jgi:uncharacterized protein YcaQ
VLRVRGLTLEPACAGDERLFPPLAEELWQYAAFNGCDEVAVEAEDAPGVAALREAVAAVAGVPDGEVAP